MSDVQQPDDCKKKIRASTTIMADITKLFTIMAVTITGNAMAGYVISAIPIIRRKWTARFLR